MQKKILTFFVISTIFISCKKEKVIPAKVPPASVSIMITNYYNTGRTSTEKINILPSYDAAYFGIINQGTGDRLLINIGAINSNTWRIPFGLSFVFQTEFDPGRINGRYEFPFANPLLRTAFRYEKTPTESTTAFEPQSGLVLIQYDEVTKTLHGTLSNIEFQYLSSSQPEYITRSIVNGSFEYLAKK